MHFDFDQFDWDHILWWEKSGANFSMNQHLFKIYSLLETHAPRKEIETYHQVTNYTKFAKFY